ncbi:hypothetical protein Golax_021376, partial [Gossypium laxum]|nr:hypothetical protein [Gossypium laxum]
KAYNNGHIPTTFVAEALACVQVVRFEAVSSFLRVEVDGDVLAIMKKILSGEEDRYEIRDYILDVKRLRSNFLGPSRLTYKVEEEEVEGIMAFEIQSFFSKRVTKIASKIAHFRDALDQLRVLTWLTVIFQRLKRQIVKDEEGSLEMKTGY